MKLIIHVRTKDNYSTTLEYRYSGTDNWSSTDALLKADISNGYIPLRVGERVCFRGYYAAESGYRISLICDKSDASLKVGGDITSLIDHSGNVMTLGDSAFFRLFSANEALTDAPELPKALLARGCCFDMFKE